jgi:pimeloyl-ACP methyl ester carboxylesterase
MHSFTLLGCTSRIASLLEQEPEPVYLVGHDSGGIAITQAAEVHPDKVAALVYLCAFLPESGQSVLQLLQTDVDSVLAAGLAIDQKIGTFAVNKQAAHQALYADCDPSDAEQAVARLRTESLALAMAPVKTTAQRWGRVPRVYIECTRDRALSPALQRRMHNALPCRRVYSLDVGHMPQYAAPTELATLLTNEVLALS